jgi:alpha-mannosidase
VDVYLIDLTLTAPSTLGTPFERELASGTPTNLLASLDVWRDLADAQPEVWSRVLSAIDAATAYLVGGELTERELPLLPLERAREELTAGVRQYEGLIGRTPYVYARRRAGLWPGLPQLLVKLGYQGALHFTLDDGRFPLGPKAKIRWEGIDTSTLDVVARVPDDAAKSETYLALSRKMADSMDNDHVATLLFAHWPAAASPWHDVLRRITRLSPVLGKFVLLDDYFSHTDMPGRLSKFGPDEYRTPYLKQAIVRRQGNALSTVAAEHCACVVANAAGAVRTIHAALTGELASDPVAANDPGEQLDAAISQLAAIFPRATGTTTRRVLVVNPLSFARRIGVTLPTGTHPPAVEAPVAAAGDSAGRSYAVVDVPAMGFAWFTPSASAAPSKRGPKPIARDNLLTNEFFELSIGSKTGGIATLFDFNRRGKQLSQQLAFRLPGIAPEPGAVWRGDDEPTYTAMRAESIEITATSTAFGEITSRGAMVDPEGRRLGGFIQRTQVWAGSRVIGLDIELTDLEEPRADPWNSYYAARFAWSGDEAELVRGVNLARQRTEATRIEAPEYVDLDSSAGHVTILTGGLPYHLRIGGRMLDSLLVVRGETARRFRLGIGVDLPQPAAAAIELLAPTTVWHGETLPPAASVGWFFHLDAKNVVATHWEPLANQGEAGKAHGFRARLLETSGRPGRVALRAFRPVISARQVDLQGQTLVQVPVEGDRMTLDFAAYEWIEVEAVWKP